LANIIKVLPDSVADKIAAGEVIVRPASAVKELMENAIDAEATKIDLIVKEAGKNLIQVIDNGKGMSPTDARLSFSRHATSKINSADDLFSIYTKGFRGEALASIAAIAQVELKTRTASDELGTEILIEGGKVSHQNPTACNKGTSLSIKNLFYNVPARRRFLKSNSVEMRHIIDEFQRIALAHPNIAFSLTHNDKELFRLRKGNLKQRIISIMGKRYNQGLVPVNEETTSLNIKGFIGKPELARKTRGQQFFFVNNRFIRSAYLNHAIKEKYSGIIANDLTPFYVIFIDIDATRIDVNVHPSKQEIKFEDEKLVYTFLSAAVQKALGAYNVVPTLDFNQESFLGHAAWIPQKPERPKSYYNPFETQPSRPQQSGSFSSNRLSSANWQSALATQPINQNQQEENVTIIPSKEMEDVDANAPLFNEKEIQPFQVHQQYIFYQTKSGVIIINQLAALERIFYSRFYGNIKNGDIAQPQQLLFPIQINLPVSDSDLLRSILIEIKSIGYLINELNENTYEIKGFPSGIPEVDLEKNIEAILEQHKWDLENPTDEHENALVRAIARQHALKANNALNADEMRSLIDQLFGCEMAHLSPSGEPTFVRMSLNDIASFFK